MNIQVNRVAGKLKELFADKIDLSDVQEKDEEICFLSRSLALYGILMKTENSPEDITDSITDGFHDYGIDAVYCDDDQKVMYLVQSKWSSEGKHSISQGDTSSFIQGIGKILSNDFEGFNDKFNHLKTSIENAISSTDYRIKAIIIYTSNQAFSNECSEVMQKFIDDVNDGIEIISFEVVKLKDVYQSLADKTNLSISLDNICLQDYGVLEQNEKEIGYYGKLSVSTIAEWWNQHGTALFSKNIRYYKGNTEVNSGIKTVLLNEPENFLLYNNGIKIVADKISKAPIGANGRKIGMFSLENASIVNGAQTTGTIGELIKSIENSIENAFVLVQIISLESLSEDMNDKITKYSNTQNRIENKDFVSLDPFQKKLQQDFSMDGIEYYYKSGYEIKNTDNSCSVDDVAIAVGCGLTDVSVAATIKSNYGKIFEKINKSPYTDIFCPKNNTSYIWNCVQIYRIFEEANVSYQKNNSSLRRLISVHGNRLLLHTFINIFNESFSLSSNFLSEDDLNQIKQIIMSKLPSIIEELIRIKLDKFPDAYPANIFKNGNRCNQMFEDLKSTNVLSITSEQGVLV
uniref:AIPR family protein n=1 Tax=Ruminococcus bicirculans (ex Wegman et al. 2014) TaxID=1160721 RepID=UPI003FD79C9E